MKTIITSTGNSLNARFDLRFGRAGWFCLYDEATGTTEFIKNEAADSTGGAGTAASQKAIELGARKIISGDFGPKAQQILERMSIQLVILENEEASVSDIIKRLKK
jgi:predicted Fe-Mo cluster-binding NifX family protein